MVERLHDGDFATDIKRELVRLDVGLVKNLDCILKPRLLVLGKLHLTERALPQGGRDDVLRAQRTSARLDSAHAKTRRSGAQTERKHTGPTRDPMALRVQRARSGGAAAQARAADGTADGSPLRVESAADRGAAMEVVYLKTAEEQGSPGLLHAVPWSGGNSV